MLEKEGHAVPPRCALKDLTVPTIAEHAEDTEGAAVQGVVQVSEDGAYVYFVAKGALAAGATEQQCRPETEQEERGEEPKQTNLGCNLYAIHNAGAPVLVATLAANDSSDWSSNSSEPEKTGPGITSAVVSPSGSYLAFMSERSLTGYDNREAQQGDCEGKEIPETGEPRTEDCREAFLYDAATSGLVCASCNPSGARPVGFASFRPEPAPAFGGYRPRNLLDDGTLFFNSSDALVAHASDGLQNVYEYEDGHVDAISNVAGSHESFFMDASADGRDVFFATADGLLPEDTGNNIVVYDARVGGGFPVAAVVPACSNADSCKPPVSAQPGVFGAPASATFSGPGNMVVSPSVGGSGSGPVKPERKAVRCARGRRLEHGRCVKRRPKKARKSSDHREGK